MGITFLNLKWFSLLSSKIQVALWMAGKMCGICGKYDGECEQEFRMPNGYLAKDAVSFGHSWILEEKPCTGGMSSLTNRKCRICL